MSATANQNYFFSINNVTTSKQKMSRELQINKVYVRTELFTNFDLGKKVRYAYRFPHFLSLIGSNYLRTVNNFSNQ